MPSNTITHMGGRVSPPNQPATLHSIRVASIELGDTQVRIELRNGEGGELICSVDGKPGATFAPREPIRCPSGLYAHVIGSPRRLDAAVSFDFGS